MIPRLSRKAGKALSAAGWTVAVGESCTGGGVCEALTGIPGSSAYFLGGVVAYGDRSKTRDLGVPAALLARHGAVSEETARAMADGARRRFGGNVGIGTTGIAGPGGGTSEKPVGTVCIGISTPEVRLSDRFRFRGDREAVRRKTVERALGLLIECLAKRGGGNG
jgi:PncC family amidohydrolase